MSASRRSRRRPALVRTIALAASTGLVAAALSMGSTVAAHAEMLDRDVTVGIGGDTFVVVGNYAVWNISAFNDGTVTTPGPQTLVFDYNTGSNPPDPRTPKAYTDVHIVGAIPGDCTIDTVAFRLTCVVPALAPRGRASVTLVAKTVISDATLNWKLNVSGEPDDQNPANNTEYGANLALGKPPADTTPVHADPGGVYAGYPLASPNGQYTLLMQADGNFVESGNGRTLWSSGTGGNPGAHFRLEDDGRGTITTADEKVIWTQPTARTSIPYAQMALTNDGKLYAYDDDGTLWRNQPVGFDTLTASSRLESGQYLHSGRAKLTMTASGDLRATVGTAVVWRSKTSGHAGSVVKLRSDGNLAIYSAKGTALWSSKTRGTGDGNVLTLAGDGSLRLKHGGTTIWKR